MKKDLYGPLLGKAMLIVLSAAGGWIAAHYPAELTALCRGVGL